MTDLCAGLSNLGDTILKTLFVKTKLFTLASKQVLVQADQLKVALQEKALLATDSPDNLVA